MGSGISSVRVAQSVPGQDPDLIVVATMLDTLPRQPSVVTHVVVVQDSVDCPEGIAQDTAHEEAVVVVHSAEFDDGCGVEVCGVEVCGVEFCGSPDSSPGFGPGVGTLPGPIVMVGQGTLGTGGGTGGG